jgi:hypothetical protein
MSEIKLSNAWKVEIIESERGWGSKIDEIKYFDSEESAKAFCANFNKDNPPGPAPDWYMQANLIGRVR